MTTKFKRKNRFLSLLLALVLVFSMIPITSMTANAANTENYIDSNGKSCSINSYSVITTGSTTLSAGWYVVNSSVTVSERITISGNVHLILCDGFTLTADKGITVNSGNSLTIYGQAKGTGLLESRCDGYWASIGGTEGKETGNITINGGVINATSNTRYTPAIGSGYRGTGGTLTVNGGTVTASGVCGIGSAFEGTFGKITINGGHVTATGRDGAGIGSAGTVENSQYGYVSEISITGGVVNAKGVYGAGIGGGRGSNGNWNITISGGIVNAVCNTWGAGIGGGYGGAGAYTINITGGAVTASGHGTYAYDIGGGMGSTATEGTAAIAITGGNVNVVNHKIHDTSLICVEVTVGGATYGQSVDSVTLSSGTYNTSGMVIVNANQMYLCLKSDVVVTAVTIGGKNYPYIRENMFCIHPEYHDATCLHGSTCTVCETVQGTTNPDNHDSDAYKYVVNSKNSSKHDVLHACCDSAIETVAHTYKNGVCEYCKYLCTHPSMEGGVCKICGGSEYKYIYRVWDSEKNGVASEIKSFVPNVFVSETCTQWTEGWYYVNRNVEITTAITVTGDVNLVIADGCTLTAKKGIVVRNIWNNLTIYGQSMDTGTLRAKGAYLAAGIGGNEDAAGGGITINGGTIIAEGGKLGAGIGGGYDGDGGKITINGGTVTAIGGADRMFGAGIGGGASGSGGTVIINGGNVKAQAGGSTAQAIGKGTYGKSSGTLTDGNGNSVSEIIFTLDGATENTLITAIEGSNYGVNGVLTLDTNKLYFYLSSGVKINSIITKSGTYICNENNTFYKEHEYSADCDATCDRCSQTRNNQAEHDYEKGICKNCGAYQPAVWNSSKNYYEISNASHLMWFSCLVNGTPTDGTKQNQSANAVLMNDIDMSGVTGYTPIGTTGLYYSAEGTNKGYSGTFDGNGYAIKNLTITGSDSEQLTYGIFGTLSGKVSRLGVENLNFTKGNADCRAGGIAGQMITGSSVANCYVVNSKIDAAGKVAGGLAGCNYAGTIENCYTYKVTVTASRAGGIVGDNRGDGGDNDRRGTITNCYTDASDIQNSQRQGNETDSTAKLNETAFTGGEVTYKLNKGITDGTQVWYQTLTGDEKQNYPSFSGKIVYGSNGQYVNAKIITITGVTAENGTYNGSKHKGYTGTPSNANGYIGTYEVKYTGRNGTTYSSTEAPTNAGDYTVTISTDSEEVQYIGSVSLNFTIEKKDVTVTAAIQKIAKGEDLSTGKVTIGVLLEGHTATVTAVTKGANCKYTATIVTKDENDNDVTANYSFDTTGTYHEYDWDTATHGYKCIHCTDIDKTDSDMPTAEYKIGTSGFKKFINTITFGLFCKDYKTVEITSADETSGVKTTQYYISDKELSETELAGVTWNNYTDKLSLNAKGTYFIYVKVTDKAGNEAVYNSEGIVIFEDSTASVDIEYTRTTNTDVKANIDFNGNTIKEVKYGTSILTKGTDYNVNNDGITFTATFLETLAASDTAHTVTVSYNAGGVEWGNDSYGTKAADTAIAITVKLATGSVTNVSDVSKTYDGNAVSNPTYTSLSTGNATYEYKVQGADDSTYTTTVPKTVGTYTVRVTVAADGNYKEASTTADFTISAKEITVTIDGKSSAYGDDIVILTATDNGIVNGDTNVYSLSTTASKTASIGTYDITGTALDGNYSITFTGGENAYVITKRELTVTVVVNNKQYDGLNTASIQSVKLNNVANGDSITLVNGTPTFNSVNVANSIGITFTDFTLSGDVDVLKNYTLTQPTGITANITNGWNPVKDTEYTASTPNANGWLKEDMTVTAKDGYELSLTNTADGTWGNTLTGAVESADSSLQFYVRNKTTGAISEQVTVAYKLDKNTETTGTTGKVEFVGRSSWQTFVNNITFGLFYKDEVTVKAEANDGLSGVDRMEYAVSDKAMSLEEVKAITDWTAMPEDGVGVTVEDEKTFVYFIRITDKAGNVTYLSTDGAEYDTTLPAISGVENGATCHTTQVITVTDKNLESITVNDEPVTLDGEGKLTLNGNLDTTYAIKVTDKAGNVTEYTVTMKTIADITDSVKDITSDNVKTEDKDNLEKAKDDLEKSLEDYKDNLTDDEKKEIQDEIDRIENALEVIEKVEDVEDLINKLPDTITKGDADAIKKADEAYNALPSYEKSILDENVKKKLDNAKSALEALNKAGTSPATGDTGNLWIWFALAFLSSGGVLGTTAYNKKKRKLNK